MRAIAEEAFAMVRDYKGSHSGEHGDGLVRSEFHEAMFGPRLVRAFEEVKDGFDPDGLLNPGKIVRAPRMDDRSLLRYPPGYRRAAARDRARLVGLGRLPRRRRDVQQQRRLPQGRARRDVPLLPRDRRRAARHPRPRQHACAWRSAGQLGAGRADLRRDGATLDLCVSLQGLPARMPDRRRHGADEDRGAAPAPTAPWPDARRPPDRLSAALCALRRRPAPLLNLRDRLPRRGGAVGARCSG